MTEKRLTHRISAEGATFQLQNAQGDRRSMRSLVRMPIMRSKAQAWHALSLIREEMRNAAAFVFALCGTETWHALTLALALALALTLTLALVGEEEPPSPFSSLRG
jgi:hydroxylamine reductase (hybrid-cluster protein)